MKHYSPLNAALFGTLVLFCLSGARPTYAADQRMIDFSQGLSNANQNRIVQIYAPTLRAPNQVGAWLSDSLSLFALHELVSLDLDRNTPFAVQIVRDLLPWNFVADSEAVSTASQRASNPDLIIWGKVFPINEDTIAQLNISLAPHFDVNRIEWIISVPKNGLITTIATGLPSNHFEFEPIIIPADVVGSYGADYAPKLFNDSTLTSSIGDLGDSVKVVDWEKNSVEVQSESLVGWLPVVRFSNEYRDLTDICASLMFVFDQDWLRAARALDRVLAPERRAHVPQGLLIDLLLLRGFIDEKQAVSGLRYFKAAEQLNPLESISVRYVVTAEIAELLRSKANGRPEFEINRGANDARNYLANHRSLFAEGESWFRSAEVILTDLASAAPMANKGIDPFVVASSTFKGRDFNAKKGK
jgi:hypothetical protein